MVPEPALRHAVTAGVLGAVAAVALLSACDHGPSAPVAPEPSATIVPRASTSGYVGASGSSIRPAPVASAADAGPPTAASLDAGGPCAQAIAEFDQRGGALGVESPGMTSVDTWDQDCQWRVEDLEQASMAFWAMHRGQGDASALDVVAASHAAVESDLSRPEFVNGGLPPDKLARVVSRVRIGRCLADAGVALPRLRVRFTVPAAGGAPHHIATDYRVPLSDDAKACIAKQFASLQFPSLDLGKWAIVVRSFDTKR
jgi:hypothetical protein